MTLDRNRLKEMLDYGYTWFGMYPVKSEGELQELMKLTGGEELYTLYPDNTEDMLDDTIDFTADELIGIDISSFLYKSYHKKFGQGASLAVFSKENPSSEFISTKLYDLEFVKSLI